MAETREYRAELVNRRWLSPGVFELELARPRFFEFLPGQRIRLLHRGMERDYSLVSTPGDPVIALCVSKIEGGGMSPFLASAKLGSTIRFIGPLGYFTFRSSLRPAVFVATGVGVAPFVSMVRSGVRILTMLHGVRVPAELYYEPLLRDSAKRYVPCLSRTTPAIGLSANAFEGRVTEYLRSRLGPGLYDFYVCGRSEMVRDVILLVDELFPGSLVYSEIFY